jgi:Rieske Fe-S protein
MSPRLDPQHPDRRPSSEQPRWRRDFPIETVEDEYVSRRDFAKFLVLTSGAMVAGQAFLGVESAMRRSQATPQARPIAREEEIAERGVLRFDYPEPGDPCLLVRLEDERLVAFSQRCTHLSCAVIPETEAGRFVCPCHKGSFDLASGQPLAGPPRRPLPRIRLEVRDGVVYATGVELGA